MAHYNYKCVMYDLIPKDFYNSFIEEFEEDGSEYDYDSNYDGHHWLMAAEYIKQLQERDKILTALESAGVDCWSGYDLAMEDFD